MTKPEDKNKSCKNNLMKNSKAMIIKKKVSMKKINPAEQIDMSKQLAYKKKTNRSIRHETASSNAPQICGNGKPMPSLSELEIMFESSDNEDSEDFSTSNTENSKLTVQPLTETSSVPVIPQKKSKKRGLPYVIDCTDRPQILKKLRLACFKDGDDYGVKVNDQHEEENEPDCTEDQWQTIKYSNSVFNAKSKEIAELLKERDLSDVSTDSNNTVTYDYTVNNSKSRPFSPLPSTSKDNETILKNDQRFNESLICENLSLNESQNDIEIIEIPCETVLIDNEEKEKTSVNYSCIKINDSECISIDDADDSAVKLVETVSKSLITIDSPDYYSSVDVYNFTNDIEERIDVDEVIAENKNIIEKYCKNEDSCIITNVEPTTFQDLTAIEIKSNDTSIDNSDNPNLSENIHANPDSVLLISPQDKSIIVEEIVKNLFNKRHEEVTQKASTRSYQSKALSNSVEPVAICSSLNGISMYECSGNAENIVTSTNNQINNTRRKNKNDSQKRTLPATFPSSPPSTGTVRKVGDCPICMENLSNKTIASTICGHIFCMPCIKQHLKLTNKKCPTCRKVLRGNGYHPLYL